MCGVIHSPDPKIDSGSRGLHTLLLRSLDVSEGFYWCNCLPKGKVYEVGTFYPSPK